MEDHFAGAAAERYDADCAERFEPEHLARTANLLAELAGDGRALEFGIGTGRVALPLAERGVPVSGIELSEDMLAQLRAKPGSEALELALGDFAHTKVTGACSLTYLVFNTINNLTTQEDQLACFTNAAAHLEPGGAFLIEVGVPALRKLPPGQDTVVFAHHEAKLGFDVYDVAHQGMSSHHIDFAETGVRYRTIPFRYVWPAELDLMARMAGMHLVHRWSDWNRAEFTSESEQHISVWRKAA